MNPASVAQEFEAIKSCNALKSHPYPMGLASNSVNYQHNLKSASQATVSACFTRVLPTSRLLEIMDTEISKKSIVYPALSGAYGTIYATNLL